MEDIIFEIKSIFPIGNGNLIFIYIPNRNIRKIKI